MLPQGNVKFLWTSLGHLMTRVNLLSTRPSSADTRHSPVNTCHFQADTCQPSVDNCNLPVDMIQSSVDTCQSQYGLYSKESDTIDAVHDKVIRSESAHVRQTDVSSENENQSFHNHHLSEMCPTSSETENTKQIK